MISKFARSFLRNPSAKNTLKTSKRILMPIQIRLTSEMSGMQGLNIMSASPTHSKDPSEVDQRTYWESEKLTSISFSLSDKPGVLLEALAVLVKNSINMTRI
jgi:hypothetical protein